MHCVLFVCLVVSCVCFVHCIVLSGCASLLFAGEDHHKQGSVDDDDDKAANSRCRFTRL